MSLSQITDYSHDNFCSCDRRTKNPGKYLPPPARRICPPYCIHSSDLKGERPCTWHEGKPCVAHCYNTSNGGRGYC